MGASSRGTSAASGSSGSRGLSTRSSSRATDVSSVPATPLLSQSPDPPNPPSARSPSPLRARSADPSDPQRAHSPDPPNRFQAGSPEPLNPLRARSPDLATRVPARTPEPLNIPSVRTPEPLNLAWQGRAAAPLERISEGGLGSPAPVSPDRKLLRSPTRFSPDVEAHLDAKEGEGFDFILGCRRSAPWSWLSRFSVPNKRLIRPAVGFTTIRGGKRAFLLCARYFVDEVHWCRRRLGSLRLLRTAQNLAG